MLLSHLTVSYVIIGLSFNKTSMDATRNIKLINILPLTNQFQVAVVMDNSISNKGSHTHIHATQSSTMIVLSARLTIAFRTIFFIIKSPFIKMIFDTVTSFHINNICVKYRPIRCKEQAINEKITKGDFYNMGLQTYLVKYNALRAFPMDLGKILSIYGITTQKALLSKFTIKQKILPVMVQHADPNLTIPTLSFTIDAIMQMMDDTAGVYIPDFGQGEELVELFTSAIAHFSPGTAPEVMGALISQIDDAKNRLCNGPAPVKLREWKLDLVPVLDRIKSCLTTNQEAAIGYAITARQGSSPITVGNAVISSLTNSLNIDPTEDLRSIIFTDPFDGLSVSVETMTMIDQIATAAGKAISSTQSGSNVLEGAKVLSSDISDAVVNYLVEVRCATSNVRSLIDLCEGTNCDMECELFEATTAEDCVADIPSTKLGWGDLSILTGDKDAIKANTDDIFSMNQITGKNIQYVLGSIITSDNETTRKVLTEKLKNAIVETMKWESVHENYMDIPVARYVDTSITMLETLTRNTKYVTRLETTHNMILEGIKAAMEDDVCVQGVFNPCAYTLNSITPFPVGVRASHLAFDNIVKAETDEEMDKAMVEFAKVYNVEENVFYRNPDGLLETNAVAKGARDVSRKVQKGSEKAIRNVGGTAHEIKQAAHNAVDPMEKYIGQMMEKLKKEDGNRRREIIIKGGVMPKVLRWIKRSIPLIAGAAIGAHVIPAAAVASGIAFIGFIASDKYLDAKEKRKVLREIEDELEIVNEKIDDARGDSNKQKRYELIRIRNNLKRTQDRIKYNLKE